MKRIFLMVLDSFGVGASPDAKDFNDEGSHTLRSITESKNYKIENLKKLGLYNIDEVNVLDAYDNPIGSYGKMQELSKGKDTTTGHWEMMGVISKVAMPTFPNGFPEEFINEFEQAIKTKVLCNKPYSGTEVIKDYGDEHVKTGYPIVYTSADSVFQIAAHESVIPLDTLYEYCKIARSLLKDDLAVGRVIARPFIGESGNYTRTPNRHDFSLVPPKNALNYLKDNNKDVIAVGKIFDIFAGSGVTEMVRTTGNTDGLNKTLEYQKKDFDGLCFVNLVDFDMLYGHRNDVDGYAKAMTEFDNWLNVFIPNMQDDDLLMITADHGCDPKTPSTDHSREYVPMLVYGKKVKSTNLGIRNGFCDLGKTILDIFDIDNNLPGKSFKGKVL
jgi:phosphopentomutase